MENTTGEAPSGWYPDPAGSGQPRWWDGKRWAGQQRPSGPGRVLLVSAMIIVSLVAAASAISPAIPDLIVESAASALPAAATETGQPAPIQTVEPVRRESASPKASPYAPTPGREASTSPLGAPAPLEVISDSYTFLPEGSPGQTFVAYDPCRPIHYVVREANSPDGGLQVINERFAELSRVTGMVFIYDGPTQEGPDDERKAFQPDVYGDRWAPILITWTSTEEYPTLASRETPEGTEYMLGSAGSNMMARGDGRRVYVSGLVTLNAPALAKAAAYDGSAVYSSVIAHELAHLVGVGHVDDPTQLMYPITDPQRVGYAAGDLTALTKLGQGPCVPEL